MRQISIRFAVGAWFAWIAVPVLMFLIIAPGDFAAFAQQASKLSNIDRRMERRQVIQPPSPEAPVPMPEVLPEKPDAWRTKPFVLGGVVIEGATVFELGVLTKSYEEFLARSVTAKDIETILQRLTGIYRDAGYFLTRAVAPRQSVRAGVIRLRIIEGYIERVSVVGRFPSRNVIDRYADAVLNERPSKLGTVERMLLFTNDLPGVSVVPTLKAIDEAAGQYEMLLNLTYRPVNAFAQIDNLGTPEVGRLQGLVTGTLNSPFGLGERIQATFITVPDQPKELLYGSLDATLPVAANGARVSLLGAYGAADAGGEKRALDSESESNQFIARIHYPTIRSRNESLWLIGTFDFRNFREWELGKIIARDRIRVFRLGAQWFVRDRLRGQSQYLLEASQGFDFLEASEAGSPTLSRPDGRSDFTKFSGKAVRRQPLSDRIDVELSLLGQFALNPLLSYEEFALGGEVIGRGYDFSEVSGDSGVASSVELRYTQPSTSKWLDRYQLYLFVDAGAVWNRAPGSSYKRDTLASTGAGLRLTSFGTLQASIEGAKPLTGAVETRGDDDWVVFFTLSARY